MSSAPAHTPGATPGAAPAAQPQNFFKRNAGKFGCMGLLLVGSGATCAAGLGTYEAIKDQMHWDEKGQSPLSTGAVTFGTDLNVPAALADLKKSAKATDAGQKEALTAARATLTQILADEAFQGEAGGEKTWSALKAPKEDKAWTTEGMTVGYQNPALAVIEGAGKVAYGPDFFAKVEPCEIVKKEFVVEACNTWGGCDGMIGEKMTPGAYAPASEVAYTWCVNGTAEKHAAEKAAAEKAAAEKAAAEAKAAAEKAAAEAKAAEDAAAAAAATSKP